MRGTLGLQKRNLARLGAAGAAMVCLVFAVRREYSLLGVSDAFAVTGLLFLILALFRTARYMRFYDLPIYGFKKFVEIWRVKEPSSKNSKLGNYGDFVRNYTHEKNYGEAYVLAAVLLAVSAAAGSFV